jgi:hypothetical protein
MFHFTEELEKLFTREATLQEVLRILHGGLERQEEKLQSTSPLFHAGLPFRRREKRALVDEARQTRDLLRAAIQETDRIREKLHHQIEYELEQHLREFNPEYRAGLEANAFLLDLDRCLAYFRKHILQLRKEVGVLRNTICSGYDRDRRTYSEAACKAYEATRPVAEKVQNDVRFFNELRDKHKALVSGGRFEAVTLPEIPEGNYTERIDEIMDREVASAIPLFPELLWELENLDHVEIEEIREGIQRATQEHEECKRSFVAETWEQVNSFARESWVVPEELQAAVEELERQYAGAQ